MDFPALYNSILHYTRIPEGEYESLISVFNIKHLKKGDYQFKCGEICKQGVFVLEGCLSYFLTDEDGKERIVDLGTTGWWMGDSDSLFYGSVSQFNLKAVSTSTILTIDSGLAHAVFEKYPWYLQYHYFALLDYRKRTDLLLSNALHNQAEQKYLAMIRQRPEIFQLAPLYDIASFLGITPQSLSRLRKTLAHKEV